MMDFERFEKNMKVGRRLGITIASNLNVYGHSFIGTYKHLMGMDLKEFNDPIVRAIAEELLVMQAASRLIVGKFFYASMNLTEMGQRAELFYDERDVGEDYKKEIHAQFVVLMQRFAEWLYQPN